MENFIFKLQGFLF